MKAAATRAWPAWLTRLAAAALAALSAAAAGAQDLTITPEGRQGSYNVFLARDADGREMTVLSEGPINEAEEKALLALSKRAVELHDLKLRSARVLLAPGEIDVLLIPRSYAYQGQDLMPFLPGGIGLILDGALSYDFRMLVGHYFLRLKGPLESEDALSRKLVEAATTPAAFLRADTMQYVSDRFKALEDRLTDDEGRGTAALQSLQAKVGELETRGGGAALKDLAQARTDIDALKGETAGLRAAVDGVKGDLESVKAALLAPPATQVDADVEALQKTVASLGVDAETLRTAVVVLQSRGGNFGRRGVDRDAISRLVALKRQNPALTQADASKALKAQGASMSNRDIALVFGIFFGDYR